MKILYSNQNTLGFTKEGIHLRHPWTNENESFSPWIFNDLINYRSCRCLEKQFARCKDQYVRIKRQVFICEIQFASFASFFLIAHAIFFSILSQQNRLIALNYRKSDCIYHFLTDLKPNWVPFSSKSIGKWWIQSGQFNKNQQ